MLEKTINNATSRYCFAVNNNRSKKWIKIHAMQLFIKVAELEVFHLQQISSCQGKCFAPDTGTGTSTWRKLLSTPRGGSNSRQKARPYYQRAKDVLVISTNWTSLFQRDATSISGKLHRHPARNREKPVTAASVGISAPHPGIELELSSHDRPVDILHDGF